MATTWGGDGRPEWVPAYVPSVDAVKTAYDSLLDNVKSNIQTPGKNKMELAIELTLVVIQFAGILLCFIGVPMGVPPWFLSQILGIALIGIGAFFFFAAAATLGTKLTFLPTPTPGYSLITVGVYERCRHPQYFGVIAVLLGLSLATLSPERLVWATVVYLVLDKKADIEEMYIAEEKPEAYPDYAASKPKFFPGRLVTGSMCHRSELTTLSSSTPAQARAFSLTLAFIWMCATELENYSHLEEDKIAE